MAKHSERDNPHKLIHVVTGTIAGIGIGLLTGYFALQIFLDAFDVLVGSHYVGDATAFVATIAAGLTGLQAGLWTGRKLTSFLRDAGAFASWLFLIAFLLLAILAVREAYLQGFLPTI